MTAWMYLSTFHDVVKPWRDAPVDGPGAQTCSWQSISWQTCHEHVCGNGTTETVQRRLRKTWSYTKSGGGQKGIFLRTKFSRILETNQNLLWEALFENDTGMSVKIKRATGLPHVFSSSVVSKVPALIRGTSRQWVKLQFSLSGLIAKGCSRQRLCSAAVTSLACSSSVFALLRQSLPLNWTTGQWAVMGPSLPQGCECGHPRRSLAFT